MTMSSPSVIREEDPSYTLGDDVWRIKYSLSPNSSHSEDENTSANPRPSNEQGWSWLMTTVMQLCLELWPDKERPDFNLERMQGGTFNRIIGITAAGTGLPNNGKPQNQVMMVRRLTKHKEDTYYVSRVRLIGDC